ncbi:methylmalonyl-CoA epimerase [Solitalea canadensis]|uniref:Methylmalonyl-CoA epimerase n=1 Tax=Solitalea canadensis (strain ATCC 29591 / DSM 3403 / JCM 21819 / LMG 8368 / NBRC 15130 / NCIMB 12057 / USAM 9D) TaxID=929556 RepID=H8KPK2_SOLCM|nr:methylmalonyl-CoA epimerase [Solitalea canadensis]AFD05900.1 methylmalonyl-CoA epimerase [Solitalea canadensis DSM 3403]
MLRIDHIGVAVKDLQSSTKLFEQLLGTPSYKTESVASEKVTTEFFEIGESKIELLLAESEDSPIAKFIEKRGEGIHHIAFEVENIENEIERLKNEGFQFIADHPKKGADNKLICFLHPKSTNGVLVELCQSIY